MCVVLFLLREIEPLGQAATTNIHTPPEPQWQGWHYLLPEGRADAFNVGAAACVSKVGSDFVHIADRSPSSAGPFALCYPLHQAPHA